MRCLKRSWTFWLLIIGEICFGQKGIYYLEQIELKGSERLTVEQIRQELDLHGGRRLNDELVMSAREKLLGLGLFKSVLLYMRKGSEPGRARLIIEVEDDDMVLGPWAMGGEVSITSGEPRAGNLDTTSPSLGYRAQLISRNLLGSGHRASFALDIDSKTVLREGHIAYGMPRFARESVQFDAQLHIVDVSHRYLNTLGFGQKGEAFWSQDRESGTLNYGVAMYLNRKQRFDLPGYPSTIAGPRIGYESENRLLGFVPSPGWGYGASFLFAPAAKNESVFEFNLATTLGIADFAYLTLSGEALTVGVTGLTTRIQANLDLPFAQNQYTGDLAKLFINLRAGSDDYENTSLVGSAATFGIRYHSSGIIAELAIKVTKVPSEVKPLLNPKRGEIFYDRE